MASITSTNSTYILTIPGVFPIPQVLQGYATDAAFDTDQSQNAEVVMGVDGKMSAGYVPFITNQTIHLQADSLSVFLFEAWLAAEKAINEKLFAIGVITLPSVRRTYTLRDGVLTSSNPIASVQRTLQPRDFTISWGSIDPVPFGA